MGSQWGADLLYNSQALQQGEQRTSRRMAVTEMLAEQIRSGTAHAERVPDPNAQHPLGAEVTQLHPELSHDF